VSSSVSYNGDPFAIRKLYKYLRVVDVCDAMDGIGYFDIGLMSPEVRPLWLGMKFWGPALTIRCRLSHAFLYTYGWFRVADAHALQRNRLRSLVLRPADDHAVHPVGRRSSLHPPVCPADVPTCGNDVLA